MGYQSDIVLGERYRDDQTGIEGVATAITFHQHACERVLIEFVHPQKGLEELSFDAPRLTHIGSGQRATSEQTGGPDHSLRNLGIGLPRSSGPPYNSRGIPM